MKYLTAIIVIVFVGIVLFGFASVSHGVGHEMGTMDADCPIMTLISATCTPNALSMALSHISALQSFSSTPASAIFLFSTVLALLGFAFTFAILPLSAVPIPAVYWSDRSRRSSYLYSFGKQKETSWLSLFEHSPSLR